MEENIDIKTEPNDDEENYGAHTITNTSKNIPLESLQTSFKVETLPVNDDSNVHTLSVEGTYQCKECDKSFYDAILFMRHMRSPHTGKGSSVKESPKKKNSPEVVGEILCQDIKIEEDPLLLENTSQIALDEKFYNESKVQIFPFLQENTSLEALDESDRKIEESTWLEGKRKESTNDEIGQPNLKRAKANNISKSSNRDIITREQQFSSESELSDIESEDYEGKDSDDVDYVPSDDEKKKTSKRKKKEKELKHSKNSQEKNKLLKMVCKYDQKIFSTALEALDDWNALDYEGEDSIEDPPEDGSDVVEEGPEDGLLEAVKSMEAGKVGPSMAAATGGSAVCGTGLDTPGALPEPSISQSAMNQPNLLLDWPLYTLSQEWKDLSILRFLGTSDDHSRPLDLCYFENTKTIQLVDFYPLCQDVVLGVGVAMLWGFLPSFMVCQCGGPMELRRAPKRYGTWLTKIWAPVGNIMEVIFMWFKDNTQKQIYESTSLNKEQVCKIIRACRLTAAKFMLDNPELNKIGGQDGKGNPIVCQVDETHFDKIKYHKGKRHIANWVLGGIEMKNKDNPDRIPKFFAMTLPNRKKGTIISMMKFKIKENSYVWTEGYAAYFTLGSHFSGSDYINQPRNFIEHSTGVYTNDCEGAWKWLEETIPDGSPRSKVEEYVQLYCFKQWLKIHPQWECLGFFGGLGRASAHVFFPEPPPSLLAAPKLIGRPAKRSRGRPAKSHRRTVCPDGAKT